MLLGRDVAPVLDAMMAAGGKLFKGVRTPVAAHPDPAVRSNPVPAPEGLILSKAFIEGARELSKRNLVLDLWVYQSQLEDVTALATLIPDLQLVVNHAGGPLGVGPYAQKRSLHFQAWQDRLFHLAQCPNVVIKLGGFGMPIMGLGFSEQTLPPTSLALAHTIQPYIDTCIDLFGHSRCLFESNFPVDKGSFSYAVIWNAFYRVSASWSDEKRRKVFSQNALRVYQISLG
ncbi:amidohydrolase family protein [Marinomonas spartinae]|uniref:amidohydrolase family protein n=1 Tax=Marinomonas spartinae TaxID=1792290 RepID=UPI001C2F67B7|nr:amidohydrolase family protein [Marinomonas spartinae]